jgi:hypothetical protein
MVFCRSRNSEENILFYYRFLFLIFLEVEDEGQSDKGCKDLNQKVYQEMKQI